MVNGTLFLHNLADGYYNQAVGFVKCNLGHSKSMLQMLSVNC
jgi:hypothetical protein